MARRRILVAGFLAGCLGACVSAPSDAPAWFLARDAATEQTYPNLRDMPTRSDVNTDAAHWDAVAAELNAAAAAMRASPRAEPAPPEDPSGFVDQARRELEAARDAHPQ